MVEKTKGRKEEVVTREYTINLHKRLHGCRRLPRVHSILLAGGGAEAKMASRGKRKTSKTQPTDPNKIQPQHLHPNNDISCFEGDRLYNLLTSFQREIECEKQSNKVLPEKLWYKRQFAIGVNEVTRILERMNPSNDAAFGTTLQAVLVASDCNPRWLTKHLPSLASSRKVPLIYLRDKKEGSLRLGEFVKVKTAIAVGIKAKGSMINGFVRKVIDDDKLNGTG